MNDFNRNKFWVSLSRNGNFAENDKAIFRVYPLSDEKNHGIDSMSRYIEAKNLESAREKVHKFIDKMFDDYQGVDYQRTPAAERPKPQPLMAMDSLCIGDNVQTAPVQPTPVQPALLDLTKLV